MTVLTFKKALSNYTNGEMLSRGQSEEISYLRKLMAEAKSELRVLSMELEKIELEISAFLDEYYKSVGKYFKKSRDSFNSNAFYNNLPKENPALDNLIKKLYKKLAKMCHPDIAGSDNSKFIIDLNEAYNSKNLQELIKIEEYLIGEASNENEGPQEKLQRLYREYDQILKSIDESKSKKNKMENSPAYELKKKVIWAKMQGDDLIAEIKKALSQQINTVKE